MRNCQVRLNMNYEVYIEESSLVRVLGTVIDEIYLKEDYTIVSRWNGAVPEDIMMKILIYGYMNDSFSSIFGVTRRKAYAGVSGSRSA